MPSAIRMIGWKLDVFWTSYPPKRTRSLQLNSPLHPSSWQLQLVLRNCHDCQLLTIFLGENSCNIPLQSAAYLHCSSICFICSCWFPASSTPPCLPQCLPPSPYPQVLTLLLDSEHFTAINEAMQVPSYHQDCRGRCGQTALHVAAVHGQQQAAQVLLDHPRFTQALDGFGLLFCCFFFLVPLVPIFFSSLFR